MRNLTDSAISDVLLRFRLEPKLAKRGNEGAASTPASGDAPSRKRPRVSSSPPL